MNKSVLSKESFLNFLKERNLIEEGDFDNVYEVYANLPGFSKDEIHLNFDGGYLNISAKHKVVEKPEHVNYLIKERSLRSKKRSIYFGDLNEDHIQAKYNDGVLVVTIYLKKPEDKKVSTISIE